MSETSTLIGYAGRTINRDELALVLTPPATATHQPVPHHEIVQALVETLGFRHIGVVHDEYAVSPDGMKMFGVLDLETEMHGARFSIGLRNSHDKTMRLALTCGYRVFVCSNMAFSGDFTPVLAKHSKSLNLVDSISVGVDRMQRNFAPMQKQVESWQSMELSTVSAKMIVYEAFIESELEVPKHLARRVHDLYFEPQYEEFRPRTMWSLSNAFTSAFKELDPIPQFKATAKLGAFLEERLAPKEKPPWLVQIAARPPGTCGLLRPSRLMAWIAGRTKHSTKNSLFVGSAAGDMTSASGMARKSCVRSAFHQIASRLRRSN